LSTYLVLTDDRNGEMIALARFVSHTSLIYDFVLVCIVVVTENGSVSGYISI